MTRMALLLLAGVVMVVPPPVSDPGPFLISELLQERRARLTTTPPDPLMAPLVRVPVPSSPTVRMALAFRAGSSDDPPGKEGLAALTAAFIAHGGTRGLTGEQIEERLYPTAGTIEAVCGHESTVFAGTAHHEVVTRYTHLFTAVLTNPRFDPEDFERIRAGAIRTLERRLTSRDGGMLAVRALEAALYPGHPFGRPVDGTPDGLRAITLEDVKSFYERYYNRESVMLGLAGSADNRLVDLARIQFSPLPAGTTAPSRAPVPRRPEGLEIVLVEAPVDATAIAIGLPLDAPRGGDDALAMTLAASCLAGPDSPLASSIELRPLDVAVRPDRSPCPPWPALDALGGPAEFIVRLRPVDYDRAVPALRLALEVLDRLAREGLSAVEFQAGREQFLDWLTMRGQTLADRLDQALEGLWHKGDETTKLLRSGLPRLSRDQVGPALARRLSLSRAVVAIVTSRSPEVRAALDSVAADLPGGRPRIRLSEAARDRRR